MKYETQEDITRIKKEYYTEDVLKRITQDLFIDPDYREFAILNANPKQKIAFRGITFSNPNYFKKTMFSQYNNLNFFNNDANMYCSVARIKQLPRFSFNTTERKKETSVFFRNEYKKYITHFDLYIDFDLNKQKYFDVFIAELENVIQVMCKYVLNFELIFSGSRGFKLLIYNENYPYEEAIKIVQNLPHALQLEFADTIGCTIPSKLMKANYSLCFKNNVCNVVFPIHFLTYKSALSKLKTDQSFEMFSYEHNKDYVKKTLNLKSNFFYKTDKREGGNRLNDFVKDYKLL